MIPTRHFCFVQCENCIPNESINILLVSHKQYWWAAEQSYIPSFLIRKFYSWLIIFLFVVYEFLPLFLSTFSAAQKKICEDL